MKFKRLELMKKINFNQKLTNDLPKIWKIRELKLSLKRKSGKLQLRRSEKGLELNRQKEMPILLERMKPKEYKRLLTSRRGQRLRLRCRQKRRQESSNKKMRSS